MRANRPDEAEENALINQKLLKNQQDSTDRNDESSESNFSSGSANSNSDSEMQYSTEKSVDPNTERTKLDQFKPSDMMEGRQNVTKPAALATNGSSKKSSSKKA